MYITENSKEQSGELENAMNQTIKTQAQKKGVMLKQSQAYKRSHVLTPFTIYEGNIYDPKVPE